MGERIEELRNLAKRLDAEMGFLNSIRIAARTRCTEQQSRLILENQIVNDNRSFGLDALIATRDYFYLGQLLQHIFGIDFTSSPRWLIYRIEPYLIRVQTR